MWAQHQMSECDYQRGLPTKVPKGSYFQKGPRLLVLGYFKLTSALRRPFATSAAHILFANSSQVISTQDNMYKGVYRNTWYFIASQKMFSSEPISSQCSTYEEARQSVFTWNIYEKQQRKSDILSKDATTHQSAS